MARMPQIKPIDYQGVAGNVPRVNLAPVDGGERALAAGAEAVQGLAGDLTKNLRVQQAAAQDAADKKQAIVDEVAGTKDGLDFSVSMSKLADGIKTKNWDTPEKAQSAFIEQAQQAADIALNLAPNTAVGMKVARMNAETIKGFADHLGTWSSLRATQQAKASLAQMVNDGSAVAEKQITIGALSAYTESFLKLTAQSRQGTTVDADGEAQKTREAFAKAWVTTHSKADPLGTLDLLNGTGNYLTKNLPPAERDELKVKTEASLMGARNDQLVNGLRDGTQMAAKTYQLFKDGQLTPGVTYDQQREISALKDRVERDPILNGDPAQRERILGNLDRQAAVIQKIDKIARMGAQTGLDDKSTEVTAKIVSQTRKLFGASGKNLSEDLAANLQLKHDAAVARASNMISDHDYRVVSNHVAGSMDTAIAAESAGGAGVKAAIESHFGWLSARQEGDRALDQYIDPDKGQFQFNPEERNMAWIAFMGQINSATEAGQNIDAASAKAMALSAAKFVEARKVKVVK